MGLFRRESLHERLAREGGLTSEPGRGPSWDEAGIHGIARPRRWDAVVHAEAPDLAGGDLAFTALADGSLVLDEDIPVEAAEPLAEAVETVIRPPYRAEAVRQSERAWAVAARTIEIVELPPDREGEHITLTVKEGSRQLVVDGAPAFGSLALLERIGDERFEDYVLEAERLDDTFWEIRINPL